jgi:hypothetical protein
MSIAGELARFVTGTGVDDLPPGALERARMVIGLEQDSPLPLGRGLRRRMPSSVLDCRPHDISSRRRPWLI